MTEDKQTTRKLKRPGGHRRQRREDREYEVIERFGEETSYFIKTYLCRDTQTEQKYLLREIRLDGLTQNEVTRRQRELELWPELRHHNILAFVDGWQCRQRIFFVSSPAQCTLQMLLQKKGAAPPQDLYEKWLDQIASALKYLHEDYNRSQPVLHRNLKPANIMVADAYILKLSDFGCSKMLEGAENLTVSRVGTARIMSPEMVQGKPYNSKTDIWSFGITAVYVATLQDAVKARTFDTLFRKTREGEVSGIAGAYSENVQNIVNRMLHPLPDNRPSAGKLVTDMRLVFRNCTKPPTADSYPERSSQRQSREEPRTRDVAISNPWSSLSRMQEGMEDVRVSPAEAVNEELTVESLSVNVVVNVLVSTTEVQLQQPRSGSSSYSVHIDVHVRPRRESERVSSSHGQTFAARAPQPGHPATRIQQQPRYDKAPSADNRHDPTAPEDESTVQGDEPSSKPDLLLNTFPGAFGVNRRPYSGYLPPLENPPVPRMGDSAKEKKKKSNRRTSGPASSASGGGVGASGATSSATEGRGEVSQRRHGRSKSESQARDVPQELSSPAAVPVDIPPEQWESSMREYWEIATDLMYKMDPAKFWLVVKFTKLFSRQEVEMWLEENVGKGMGECMDMFERLLDLDNQLTREENVYLVESLHRTGQLRGGNHDEQRDGGQGGDNPALSRTGSSSGLGDSWDSTDF